MQITTALLGAFALCSCATTASPPSNSIAASGKCTESTADGVTLRDSHCNTAGERWYSQVDLQNTGKTTVGDALPLLDSALTVRH